MNILKRELKAIFNGLKVMIEPEWLKWLKEQDSFWHEFPRSPEDEDVVYRIISRIQRVLDSKVGELRAHSFGFLTRADVLEIADIFEIQVPGRANKRSISNLILKKIRTMCENCRGSGEVGVAISTEGPKPIFCLDCIGTGKKRQGIKNPRLRVFQK